MNYSEWRQIAIAELVDLLHFLTADPDFTKADLNERLGQALRSNELTLDPNETTTQDPIGNAYRGRNTGNFFTCPKQTGTQPQDSQTPPL
ncbi:MAG: hypothetical protein F6K04_01485 [Leptolyngbya sp. SIO4C5]|nr:hypothetical protein [Leptolyngbya sp. SIO4C5]